MPALIFEPFEPLDPNSTQPAWVIIEQQVGVGEAAKLGDVVTVEMSAVIDGTREFASTEKTGLSYTFELSEKSDEPLVKAVLGMREGGERYVNRRGLLLAVGNIQPSGALLRMQVRLEKVERRGKGNDVIRSTRQSE